MEARPSASVEIDAPLDLVWDVMLDTAAYAEWNPFCVRVEAPSPANVGDPIVLHVRWGDGSRARSPERITRLRYPEVEGDVRRAVLAYDYAGVPSRLRLVRTRRTQTLTQPVAGGPTTYATEMVMSGPGVRLAGPGRITDGFQRHAEALKRRAEALARR